MDSWMWKHTKTLLEPKVLTKYPLLYFTPALCWGIFILVFSLMPGNEVPRFMIKFNDKFVHAGIYIFEVSLIYFGFIRFRFSNKITAVQVGLIVLACVLFGGTIEILQHYFVPRRVGEWSDFIANTTGCLLAVLLVSIVHRAKA